jgi:hypothetical protein
LEEVWEANSEIGKHKVDWLPVRLGNPQPCFADSNTLGKRTHLG